MIHGLKLGVAVVGAAALTGSLLSGALASIPGPGVWHQLAHPAAKKYSVSGDLTVTHILKVKSNANIYGNTYLKGRAEVYKGLLVRKGGVRSDSLIVTGPLQAQSATIATNLQAGAVSGSSLALSGTATVGGTLTASGRITGNGVDAGAGGLTTNGSITGGALTVSAITDSGSLSATNLSTAGTLTAGSTTLGGLTVTGPINFNNQAITGLNISNLNLGSATFPTLNVGSALNVGTQSNATSPISLSENNHSVQLGVDSSGNLTVPGLTVNGNFSVAGQSNLTTSQLSAPSQANSTVPGTLTLSGSPINLNGNVTLRNGSDLTMSSSGSNVSHVVAAGDRDLAGTISVTAGVPAAFSSASVTFHHAFASAPIVVVTPTGDPAIGSGSGPKYYVSSSNTGFTLYYDPAPSTSLPTTVTFNYVVIGS